MLAVTPVTLHMTVENRLYTQISNLLVRKMSVVEMSRSLTARIHYVTTIIDVI